jgi:hypothetical protein
MASRREEKERLREHRLAAERKAGAKTKRERIVQIGIAGILGALVIGALLLTVIGGSGSSTPKPGAFGQHYGGLEQRRLEAGVPTMAEGGGSHFHPLLSVYANGRPVTVPANIGIDPANPPTEMAGLHTHDETGTIHNEAGSGATLGDFFAVWGVPLSARRLGPYRAGDTKTVRMWVDGRPSQRFGGLVLKDGQRIVVSYGTASQIPEGVSG